MDEQGGGSGKLILVADDDRDLVRALTIRLEAAGYTVIGASSGEETLNLAAERMPDLIILDIRMPGGSGFSALERIRHTVTTRSTPVLFLTAFDDEEMKEEARQLGMVGYFRKPFDDREFMAAVKSILGDG